MALSSSGALMGMLVYYARNHVPQMFTVVQLQQFILEEMEMRPEIRDIFSSFVRGDSRGSFVDLKFLLDPGLISIVPGDGLVGDAEEERGYLIEPDILRHSEEELRNNGALPEHQPLFEGLANAFAAFLMRPTVV